MEFLLTYPTAVVASIFALLLFLYQQWRILASKKRSLPPEAGGAWPLIGHLHLIGGPQPTHITLGNMADKHGPIFTIKLGVHRILVISNWEMVKECLNVNDKVFASRPKTTAMELMGYNCGFFTFSPYGSYWRQLRKIATLELLSNRRLEMFKHVREFEVKAAIKKIYDLCESDKSSEVKALVEMKKWFTDITSNLIFKIMVGKRYVRLEEEGEEDDQWHETIREFMELLGTFLVSDAFPFLRWFDFGGYKKAMKKNARQMDLVMSQWLEKHKKDREAGGEKAEQDVMGVLLSNLYEDENVNTTVADTTIKATSLALILAATDTTAVTLTWAISLVLNNRHVLKKVQDELDRHVGRERQVAESDIKNLVYLQAIIKETMRLYPAVPLSVPHLSMEDCIIAGWHVPAGTQLYVNLQKIHRDPRVWPNPTKFDPERFLTTHKDVDIKGQSFELIPFSTGRRMCPGYAFGLQVMHLTLATLLHGFDITTPSNEEVDMTESFGITYLKATPVEVTFSPRLPAHLYI